VTIFDGTQMSAGTPFTKIWRLKNIGEVPWPPGTRMLFVGGDQMTTEMSVPLSRTAAVQPGEEVDVAVEMVAPNELGRYLGYWRLVGPHGRRKFGQRVWCHVQVVDGEAAEAMGEVSDEELSRTRAEIEQKKDEIAAREECNDNETDAGDATDEQAEPAAAGASGVAVADKPVVPPPSPAAPPPTKAHDDAVADVTDAMATLPSHVAADDATEAGALSDDGVLVDEAMAVEPAVPMGDPFPTTSGATPPVGAPVAVSPAEGVKAGLAAMGFTDATMVDLVLAKHGADLEACARDLAAASEWDHLLDDLAEMGFANRELNKSLMLKHAGNVKRTVRELVEDA